MFRHVAKFAVVLSLALPGLLLASTPVNINSASATTIAKSLDGVGTTRAQAIVDWRSAHGPFKSVDELGSVKGIGKATLARNRSAILLADGADAKAKVSPSKTPSMDKAPATTSPTPAKS